MCDNVIDCDDSSYQCGDEGRICEDCFAKENTRWKSYFGISDKMNSEQRRQQLELFNPFHDEDVCRSLK
jgi:hypothetical protein